MSKKQRGTLLLQPTEVFHSWLNSIYPLEQGCKRNPPEGYSPAFVVTYFTPFMESETEFNEWLENNFKAIFKNELLAWKVEDKYWSFPADISKFYELFEVKYQAEDK